MVPRNLKSSFGRVGEDFAVSFLRQHGYKVIERNFRSRFGEIDIIAVDGDTLVFVEVKARWSKKFGAPEEAVTPQKLYKIKRTAEYFSLTHKGLPEKLRIDVVAIEAEGSRVSSARIIKVLY